jgi:hypothetical protein
LLSDSGLLAAKLFTGPGAPIWTKEFGAPTPFGEPGPWLALDETGNVFLSGTLTRPADFGGGLLTPSGGTDIFLAKYEP